jgi:hypothetical protein
MKKGNKGSTRKENHQTRHLTVGPDKGETPHMASMSLNVSIVCISEIDLCLKGTRNVHIVTMHRKSLSVM